MAKKDFWNVFADRPKPQSPRKRGSPTQVMVKNLILILIVIVRLATAIFCAAAFASSPALFGASFGDWFETSAANDDASDGVLVTGGPPPVLMFACDGSISDLESLFSQAGVISDLQTLHAGIALAVPDLTPERAQLVRRLNDAGIPVAAWLALPGEQGYYLNAGNEPQAAAHFAEFESWTAINGLRWTEVGLDIEPNIQEFAALRQGSKWRLIATLARRYFDVGRVERAKVAYSGLIRQIQSRGYAVQTYQFPFIADERAAHTTVLERVAGILDLKSDQEVLMTYTSFNPALDSALIWVYGPDAQGIVVGSTAGSASDAHFVPLNWDEFSRDLKVANYFSSSHATGSRIIGVYNLEGCVRQGFLPRLRTLNWTEPVIIPGKAVRGARRFRARVQTALWIAAHLLYFLAMFLIVVTWIVVLWRKRRRAQRPAPLAIASR
jgi:hypothetical protein